MPPDIIAETEIVTRRLWLTKVDGGRYLISKNKPISGVIDGTEIPEMDAPFDPLAIRHLCEAGVLWLLGSTLPPMTPVRIELSARILPHQQPPAEPAGQIDKDTI